MPDLITDCFFNLLLKLCYFVKKIHHLMKKSVYAIDVEDIILIKIRGAGQASCALMELSGI